jgi:hypothetical protein
VVGVAVEVLGAGWGVERVAGVEVGVEVAGDWEVEVGVAVG